MRQDLSDQKNRLEIKQISALSEDSTSFLRRDLYTLQIPIEDHEEET